MEIIRNFKNINSENINSVLTLGNFDGIHLGHQKILEEVRNTAKKLNCKSALLTFEPHPAKILNSAKPFDIRLTSLSQKLRIIQENNLVDMIFIANFNSKLANLEAKDFVKNILMDSLRIKYLTVGYDFTFGKNKSGNCDLLKKLAAIYNFGFTIINPISNDKKNIYSSTNIRNLISSGNIKNANLMMGRNYQISGIVTKGKELARTIGFPTANLLSKANLIKPKYGVYKALVKFSNEENYYPAIVNFGIKPTFSSDKAIFEAHIFNFNKNIYGQKITIELLDFIREEKKFSGINELKKQIQQDCLY